MSEIQDFKSLLDSIGQKLHAQTAPTVSVAPAKIDSGEYAAVIVLSQGNAEPTREDALWAMDQAREGDMLALAEDANLPTLCLCGKTVGKIIEDVKNQSGKALDGLPAAILYFGSQSLAEAFPESRRQATPQGELSPPSLSLLGQWTVPANGHECAVFCVKPQTG